MNQQTPETRPASTSIFQREDGSNQAIDIMLRCPAERCQAMLPAGLELARRGGWGYLRLTIEPGGPGTCVWRTHLLVQAMTDAADVFRGWSELKSISGNADVRATSDLDTQLCLTGGKQVDGLILIKTAGPASPHRPPTFATPLDAEEFLLDAAFMSEVAVEDIHGRRSWCGSHRSGDRPKAAGDALRVTQLQCVGLPVARLSAADVELLATRPLCAPGEPQTIRAALLSSRESAGRTVRQTSLASPA